MCDVVAGCNAAGVERTHGKLSTGFADGLGGDYAHRFAKVDGFASCHVAAVALAAYAVFAAAGKYGTHVQFADACFDDFGGKVIGNHCVAGADNLARGRVDNVVDDVLTNDTIFKFFDDFVLTGTAEGLDPHTLRTAACRAVLFAYDNVLRYVYKTTGKITGVCRFKCRIGKTFTSAV